ncbi:ATP-dependent nuclease [Fusibacter ferrireducens]|uniref:AAA family ATPase n=1 Tax=Fusibacter ferrireducens TaxID=2785058 RepID=A0ABR9ZXA5_9FIRM|nr:AAA family ATPase [Fusibacter ferrireducens]MBF4695087.1 AAA family ATPase [Fusibacter ferrireducens]
MYIKELNISGFRNFESRCTVRLNKGLNVLIGENGSGKTGIIDSLRLLLGEDEYGKVIVRETDFSRPFANPTATSKSIDIDATFSKLSPNQAVDYLPWLIGNDEMKLSLHIDNKKSPRGRYSKKVWVGASSSSHYESELLDLIQCIYLPPLRDAERKLNDGRSSRLASLIMKLNEKELIKAKEKGELHELEQKAKIFNDDLIENDIGKIGKANTLIRDNLKKSLGSVFGQDTSIQFTELTFNRIVERLQLLFFPELLDTPIGVTYRSLEENSLGYNNLIYLATVLAELMYLENSSSLNVLLVEEPEAHLHPQLQSKLLEYLQKQANAKNLQIIMTTHSPLITSAVELDKIIHVSCEGKLDPVCTSLFQLNIDDASGKYLKRWLDSTKSTMLFAKGIILVEGIAELLMLPVLAELCLNEYEGNRGKEDKQLPMTLKEAGVSVVNMGGIYFKHFMPIYTTEIASKKVDTPVSIPIRCSGITDNDPKVDKGNPPVMGTSPEGGNHALLLIPIVKKSENCRLFSGKLMTFEYDLAVEGNNLSIMNAVLAELWPEPKKTSKIITKASQNRDINWLCKTPEEKAQEAMWTLDRIGNSDVGKGLFAQVLADKIVSEDFELVVPDYIYEAVIWACNGDKYERE